jgi:hypothetical protein
MCLEPQPLNKFHRLRQTETTTWAQDHASDRFFWFIFLFFLTYFFAQERCHVVTRPPLHPQPPPTTMTTTRGASCVASHLEPLVFQTSTLTPTTISTHKPGDDEWELETRLVLSSGFFFFLFFILLIIFK